MKYLILLLITFSAIAGLPPTTSKVSGDASDITTFKYQFPNFTGTHTGTVISLGVNSIAGGGTGATTKAAAFDALQPMTTGGDIIYGGASGTGTRLANGSAGQVLTSGGTTVAPSWTSVSPVFAYTAQTTAYSAAIGDFVDCTSGTFAVTLPTAVGNAAKMIKIKNTGTGVITINTTSAQTIDGYASGVIKLATTKDYITVTSDGANWKIEEFQVNISALYTGAPPTGTLTNAFNITTFGTVVTDSYSAYSGGTYTIPITGTYNIRAQAYIGGTYNANQVSEIAVFIDGVKKYSHYDYSRAASSLELGESVSVHAVHLTAGQAVTIRSYTEATTPSFSISDATRNYFSIERTGN